LWGGEFLDFTNEALQKIQDKKEINKIYSKYLYSMSLDPTILGGQRYKKRSDRINDCVNLWVWDKYEKNKLLDLQRLNRCMDNRFCSNCRKFSLASAIHNFKPSFKTLIDDGYNPYLLTLTVPNVQDKDLRVTIQKLNISFRKFFQKLSQPVGNGKHGFSERLIKFDAALKVLEITYNKREDTYHPHFHIIMFSNEYDPSIFHKCIPGAWSNKKQCYLYNSILDIQLMQLWKMCYDKIPITLRNYSKMSHNWLDLYMCDIREMDSSGVYEVLKYTFKDTDIINYNVFTTLFKSLDGQRIRQGHGLLFNAKLEDDAEGDNIGIDEYLFEKENPEQMLTREINELITVYSNYRKISRFNSYKEFDKIL